MSSSDVPPPAFWDRQDRLDRIAVRVQSYGRTDDQYNEVSVDAATNTITVFRTDPTTAVQEAPYRALVPKDVGFELDSARFTRAQVDHWVAYVGSQSSWLAQHGLTLSLWGAQNPDQPFQVLYAECQRPNQEAMDRLQIYGPKTVTFRHGMVDGLVGGGSPQPQCIGPSDHNQ
ncbi:MAG: hypothetical protein ACJ735_06290 [Actinomycetes bacterium]